MAQATMSAVLRAVVADLIANITDCTTANTYICLAPTWVKSDYAFVVQVCPGGTTRHAGVISAGGPEKVAGLVHSVVIAVFASVPIEQEGRAAETLTNSSIGILTKVASIEERLQSTRLRATLEALSFTALQNPLTYQSTAAPMNGTDNNYRGVVKVEIRYGDALALVE